MSMVVCIVKGLPDDGNKYEKEWFNEVNIDEVPEYLRNLVYEDNVEELNIDKILRHSGHNNENEIIEWSYDEKGLTLKFSDGTIFNIPDERFDEYTITVRKHFIFFCSKTPPFRTGINKPRTPNKIINHQTHNSIINHQTPKTLTNHTQTKTTSRDTTENLLNNKKHN